MTNLESFIERLIKSGLSKSFISDNAEIITWCAEAAKDVPTVSHGGGMVTFRWRRGAATLVLRFEPLTHGYKPMFKGKSYKTGASVIERWATEPNKFDVKGVFQWLNSQEEKRKREASPDSEGV